MTLVFISKVFISLVAFLYLLVARADLHRPGNRWLFDAGWALLLLLLATGIAGCEPKAVSVRCSQAVGCVEQPLSIYTWDHDDSLSEAALERALQRAIEQRKAERRWLHSQI